MIYYSTVCIHKVAMVWNDFWWKWKKSAKAGLHLNIKTRIMTTEEIHNFNMDNQKMETVVQSSIQMKATAKKSIKRRQQWKN